MNVLLHYQRCTFILVAARKNALKDLSAASLGLCAHNFAKAMEKNAVPKFTKRLTWTLHKFCK